MRPAKIIIDPQALLHNLQQVRHYAPHSKILAMVKCNAYGHSIKAVSQALKQADALGVACVDEGMRLRDVGIELPIVLMEGFFSIDEIPVVIANKFSLVIHTREQLIALEKYSGSEKLPVWLKIDTGMHRLGFQPEEVAEIYTRLQQCSIVEKPIGLMSHFSSADSLDETKTQQQIKLFNQATHNLIGPKSLSNSAGILAWPEAHADWTRPGIMLYGISPFNRHHGAEFNLKPVMTLSSELISIHDIKQGESIGYGNTFVCPRDMRVGIIAIGYGDGYPWHAKTGTPILINGEICPLIGRVAMDMINVDLSSQPLAKIGDTAILWGEGLPVETISEFSDTIPYKLITSITQRVLIGVKT